MKVQFLCFFLVVVLCISSAHADSHTAPASPKRPWGEFQVVTEPVEIPWWETTLLWLPNRFLDLVDIFRVDASPGLAMGAAVRITRYGQFGYRVMKPTSGRIGITGRHNPLFLERMNEFGIGPTFKPSPERHLCTGIIGAGVDIGIGLHLGICPEEIIDFVSGIFLIDIMGDDYDQF